MYKLTNYALWNASTNNFVRKEVWKVEILVFFLHQRLLFILLLSLSMSPLKSKKNILSNFLYTLLKLF